MKKVFLFFALTISMVGISNAQTKGSTLGLRLGYEDSDISYQHPLGTDNRLEIDLGTGKNGNVLTGIYQWKWSLEEIGPGFKFYAGGGASIGKYTAFGLAAVAQGGIEYNFTIPWQMSLDFTPRLFINSGMGLASNEARLSIRYRF